MARASNLTMCSFCGKSHAEVKKLIAGPGVYICDGCINVCRGILEKELHEHDEEEEISAELTVPKPKELFDSLNVPEMLLVRPEYERKRAETLKAALVLFGEKGFEGTTMDEIANSVGISKATLYLYFDSKEDMFSQVLSESAFNTYSKKVKKDFNKKICSMMNQYHNNCINKKPCCSQFIYGRVFNIFISGNRCKRF